MSKRKPTFLRVNHSWLGWNDRWRVINKELKVKRDKINISRQFIHNLNIRSRMVSTGWKIHVRQTHCWSFMNFQANFSNQKLRKYRIASLSKQSILQWASMANLTIMKRSFMWKFALFWQEIENIKCWVDWRFRNSEPDSTDTFV